MKPSQTPQQQIKAATQELHRSIETLPLMSLLMSEDIDLATYRQILKRLYRLHLATESHIYSALSYMKPAELQQGHRISYLEADLRELGVCNENRQDALSNKYWRDSICGPAQALGALYVLEGSRLGGKLIARQVQQKPELAVATRFFSASSDEKSGQWKSFLMHFNHCLDSSEKLEQATRGAAETFQLFQQMLGEPIITETSITA